MDLSIEKTHSAYMLFYERIEKNSAPSPGTTAKPSSSPAKPSELQLPKDNSTAAAAPADGNGLVAGPAAVAVPAARPQFLLKQELENWIWKDNMNFIQDRNIFDHTYFK